MGREACYSHSSQEMKRDDRRSGCHVLLESMSLVPLCQCSITAQQCHRSGPKPLACFVASEHILPLFDDLRIR